MWTGHHVIFGTEISATYPYSADGRGPHHTTRGERTDEILEILRKLWNDDTAEYAGRHYSFGPVHFEPKPAQRPHPPFLGGGATPAALRRAAALDGCYLPAADLDILKAPLAEIGRLREEAGRAAQPYDVTVGAPAPLTRDALRRFADAGVTRVVFEIGADPLQEGNPPVPATAEALTRNLERVAEVAIG